MKETRQKGIIQLLIMILVAIIALSYFGIDLEEVFSKPLFKKNIVFTWNKARDAWTTYVFEPITGIFNKDSDSEEKSSGEPPQLILK